MKRWFICMGLIAATFQAGAAELEWLTDLPTALAQARRENKVVLLDFTGSDWCGWCKRLKAEVFDQPQFAAFAQVNLVMVEVDFPHRKPQSPAQAEANQQLARTYHIRGYPTIILLNADGQQVGDMGYMEGGPRKFIAELENIPGIKHVNISAAMKNENERQKTETAPAKPAAFVPITPTAPIRYGDLALKGISGAKDRRLALINNETLMVGETASIKVQDGKVKVCCKEIREDSVLITVDGKPKELKLAHP